MSTPLQPTASYAAIVGATIIAFRERRGLQQGSLAQAIGVSQSTVSRIERGAISISIEQLAAIAGELRTTPGELLVTADRSVEQARQRGMRVVYGRRTTALTEGEVVVGAAAVLLLVAAALAGRK